MPSCVEGEWLRYIVWREESDSTPLLGQSQTLPVPSIAARLLVKHHEDEQCFLESCVYLSQGHQARQIYQVRT